MSVLTGKTSSMNSEPNNIDISPLEESAIRLHEIYKSLLAAGFASEEALSLIAKMTKKN